MQSHSFSLAVLALFFLLGPGQAQNPNPLASSSGVAGFGGPYSPQSDDYERFRLGSLDPLVHNRLSFPGFNFSAPLTTLDSPPDTTSSETWNLQLNLSSVLLMDSTVASERNLISNLVYGIELPGNEGSLPLRNESNYTMCASVFIQYFPTNVSNIRGGGPTDQPYDPTNSSCTPFFGETCVNAYLQRLRTASISTGSVGCPLGALSMNDVPECLSHNGRLNQTFGTTALGNFTDSNIIRNSSGPWTGNEPWYNTTDSVNSANYTLVPTPPGPRFHGLESSQPFAWRSTDPYPETNLSSVLAEAGTTLRMVVLTMFVNDEWYAGQVGSGEGYRRFDTDVRAICGRADENAIMRRPQMNAAVGVGGSGRGLGVGFVGVLVALWTVLLQ